MPTLPAKMGNTAEGFLGKQGINILYKTDFVEGVTAQQLGYQYIVRATGMIYKTDFMKTHFQKCLAPNG